MIKKQALVILLSACLFTIQSSHAVGPIGVAFVTLFKALGHIPFFPQPSSPTCWVPEGHAVKSALLAAVTGNYQNALAISGDQALSAASRCWFGQTPANLLLEAAKAGDMEQAYGALEKLFKNASENQNQNDDEIAADSEDQANLVDNDQSGVALVDLSESKNDQPEAALEMITNHKGETPLHLAALKGATELVKLLLAKGAPVDCKDNQGATPLMNAAAHGHLEIVRLLLEHNANVNITNATGLSACMLASHAGHTDIINALIDKQCNVNAKKADGATALMLAARNGRFEIVKSLVAAGANVNAAKKDGWTALMLAAFNNRLSIAKFLIEHGADSTARDNKGQTAHDHAKNASYLKVAQLMTVINKKENFKEILATVLSTLSDDEKRNVMNNLIDRAQLIPQGPYKHDCLEARFEGDNLVAKCQKKDGTYKITTLPLPCTFTIDNEDGNLVCISRNSPSH
jgi:ankyrin repeat protein